MPLPSIYTITMDGAAGAKMRAAELTAASIEWAAALL